MPEPKAPSMIPQGHPYVPPDYDLMPEAPAEAIGTTLTDIGPIVPDGFTARAARLTLINTASSSNLVTVSIVTAVVGRTIPQSGQSSVNILEANIDYANIAQGGMRTFTQNDGIVVPAGFKAQVKGSIASALNVEVTWYYTKGSGI